MSNLKKIGFVGTGIMGAAMAGHLMDAGFEVSVYNRTKSKADKLIERGAKWCSSPGECAKGQDVVITIVGYPKDVEQVYLSDDGIVANTKEGAYIVDMTTSSPILAEKIYNAAKSKNIHAVDAPVTGGDTGAKSATLTIFVGGDESAFNALKPIFDVIGKNIAYMGTAGSGQKAKMSNQIALAGALAGACEAFAYAKAAGLDIDKVYNTISTGSAGSVQMTNIVKRGLDGDFNPGFMLKHLAKDLAISNETSTAYGTALPILAMVLSQLRNMESQGKGNEGTQSLLKYYNVID
ncbi:MAG: NAD(P)-dependent oxidoreductase [Selenomonadaceae bacterium]|nr:NAD(P)-dependent oxidoreductase [Selenomonadaceae bacterium]